MSHRGAEVAYLQGESDRARGVTVCLPCRRSWVRVPSAAWKYLHISYFLVSGPGKVGTDGYAEGPRFEPRRWPLGKSLEVRGFLRLQHAPATEPRGFLLRRLPIGCQNRRPQSRAHASLVNLDAVQALRRVRRKRAVDRAHGARRGPPAARHRRRARQARGTWDLGRGGRAAAAQPAPHHQKPTRGRRAGKRLLLIGHTDGGRPLTLVIERTADPTTWLIVTGWGSTQAERKILETRQ